MILNIVHLADIQIEIRTSGEGAQRFNEFNLALLEVEKHIRESKPDAVVIPGDIFQFQQTTGDEQKMFATFLHNILDYTKRIVIIPGNHDIAQRSNGLIEDDIKRNLTDSIDAIVTAINSAKLLYYRHTGLYYDSILSLHWAVWSQIDKWSVIEPKPAYSPWINNDVPTGPFIELFHDPIRGCKDFTRVSSEHFTNYGITLADFKANLIIAGDIHAPDQLWDETRTKLFTYSSSLVQRNFGESDYFRDNVVTVDGNTQHGFNHIQFNLSDNRPVSCKFIQVQPPVARHTFRLTDKFVWPEAIKTLQLVNPSPFNQVRIICQANMTKFIEHQAELVEWFKTNWSCQVSLDFAKDVIAVDVDEKAFDDITDVVDAEKILEISKKYISSLVDKTSTIDKDKKEWAKEYMFNLFQEQMSTIDLTSDSVDIRLLDADITNFMSFGEDVHLDFANTPITVIAGTNGIGKTTIHHFIKWMLIDTISDQLDVRQKKANYLLYFNKGSELDEVYGRLRLSVNGQVVNLTKTLTRGWKKGQKDIFANNIPDRLSGTPQMRLSIESEDLTSSKTEEVEDWLDKLITFKELSRLMFVNPLSIDRLIMTKPEDLSQEFLTTIGLDFTNNLLAVYDKMKDERLAPLVKPSMTVEETVSAILVQEQDEEKLLQSQNDLSSQLRLMKVDIDEQKADIDTKRMTLHQVPAETEVSAKILDIETVQLVNADRAITSAINSHKAIVDTIEALDMSATNTELDKAQSALVDLATKDAECLGEISLATQEQETIKAKVIGRQSEIKSNHATECAKFLEAKDKLSTDIATHTSTCNTIKQEWQDLISEAISKKWSDKDTFTKLSSSEGLKITEIVRARDSKQSTINGNLAKIKQLTDEIELDESSQSCQSCGQLLKPEAIAKIEESIKAKRETIQQLTDDNSFISDDIAKLDIEQDSHEKAQKAADSSASSAGEDILEITKLKQWLVPIANEWFDATALIDKMSVAAAELEQATQKSAKIDEVLKLKQEQLTELVKSDDAIKQLAAKHAESVASIARLGTVQESIQTKINETSDRLLELKDIFAKVANLTIEEQEASKAITETKHAKIAIEAELQRLLTQIELCKLNTVTLAEIATMSQKYEELKSTEEQLLTNLSDCKVKLTRASDKKEQLVKQIDEIKLYKATDNSLKLYKKLLGKQGLPQYVFAHLVPLINKKLNESLEGVNFRLLFDQETLELRFFDLQKQVSSPVTFISGMERTVVGLALVHILRLLNRSKRFNVLMIDEISGTLNSGKTLTYESKDYQKLVKTFIEKLSQDVNIWIVDHVLEFWHARRIEVQPGASGATIVEVTEHLQ